MANYLFIHGAWHGPWCWTAVATALERQGHSVAIPTLPGLNQETQARAGSFGLADHIHAVSTAIDHIPGRLILVAHSYAGMIARALESLRRDRLHHVVYLEAVIPEPGRSLLEMQPTGAAETLRALTRETPRAEREGRFTKGAGAKLGAGSTTGESAGAEIDSTANGFWLEGGCGVFLFLNSDSGAAPTTSAPGSLTPASCRRGHRRPSMSS